MWMFILCFVIWKIWGEGIAFGASLSRNLEGLFFSEVPYCGREILKEHICFNEVYTFAIIKVLNCCILLFGVK